MHAQRQYQASVALGFAKYGGRWGWRAGVFSGIYRYVKQKKVMKGNNKGTFLLKIVKKSYFHDEVSYSHCLYSGPEKNKRESEKIQETIENKIVQII